MDVLALQSLEGREKNSLAPPANGFEDMRPTATPTEHNSTAAIVVCEAEDLRCLCGQLMARLTDQGVELKCKRCRRLMVIPFSSIEGWTLHHNHRN